MNPETPTWTVTYTIVNNTPYTGTGWEFFDSMDEADARYADLRQQGHYPTRRPFNEAQDSQHMGVAHQTRDA